MTARIGIDPGVITGMAIWSTKEKKFIAMGSFQIHKALERVLWATGPTLCGDDVHVVVEDARQRKWFIGGRERLQGAGSVKAHCSIWEEFLIDKGIEYTLVPPQKGLTKLSSQQFQKLTGWQWQTNQHVRDAAMLVYGY